MPLVPCCTLSYSYAKLLLLCCRAQEEADFREFAARPNVIELIQKRIAPQIFGAERIKEAIACLLFGGSRKVSHTFSAVCSPQPAPQLHSIMVGLIAAPVPQPACIDGLY